MTTTTTTTTDYQCPTWCARDDHFADRVDAENPPSHYAPEFGPIFIQAFGDGPFDVQILEETIEDGATGLRRIAADALSAAEWLEANR